MRSVPSDSSPRQPACAAPEVPRWFGGTCWWNSLGWRDLDGAVAVGEEVVDLGAVDAGALEGAAELAEELVDALVRLLGVDVERAGDLGDLLGAPEAHLEDQAILGVERIQDLVEDGGGAACELLAFAGRGAVRRIVGGDHEIGHRLVGDQDRPRGARREAEGDRFELAARGGRRVAGG